MALRERRVVEALRSGVPSLDAVRLLGSGQGEIEDRYATLLDRAAAGHASGLLLGGGFGSGKSHLLEHLAHLALDDGYAVSRVVVSKETPLYHPGRVLTAAVGSARVAGSGDNAVHRAAAELDPHSAACEQLRRWAASAGAALNPRFAATLALHAAVRDSDPAYAETLVRFWCGDPLTMPELRRRLKKAGEDPVAMPPVGAKELVGQRLRFVARLLAAAGYRGWVLLFDEAELIGRYSVLQRGRSYAEMGRWIRGEHGAAGIPVAAVLAMTDDFEAAVITGKNDTETVPSKLTAKGTEEAAELADRATVGMRIIDRQMLLLTPPDDAELDRAYASLKRLHGAAYGWEPPDVAGLERLGTTRMRQHVRAWINEWDLVRLDPTYQPHTEVTPMGSDYREDADLEAVEGE